VAPLVIGYFSRHFRLAYGESPYGCLMTSSCVAKQVTKPIRNREAPVTEPQLE
jgi:hypothetical protein